MATSRRRICWCATAGQSTARLIAKNLDTSTETAFELAEGTPIYLGRDTVPDLSPYVSGRHVRVCLGGGTLYIDQVDRNETLVTFTGDGGTFRLRRYRENLDAGRLATAVFRLADTPFKLHVR